MERHAGLQDAAHIEVLAEFEPYPPHGNPIIANYQKELLRLYDALEGEEEGRRYMRFIFSRSLNDNLHFPHYYGQNERKGKFSFLSKVHLLIRHRE